MSLLNLPAELRLKIYAELLVLPHGHFVKFTALYGPSDPALTRFRRGQGDGDELCPALLRTSRAVCGEALPLLYGLNRFCFPDAYVLADPSIGPALGVGAVVPYVGPFLRQIGARSAGLVRHVTVNLPRFSLCPDREPDLEVDPEADPEDDAQPSFDDETVRTLQLVRHACTGLRTLTVRCDQAAADTLLALRIAPLVAGLLRALDAALGIGEMSAPETEVALVVPLPWCAASDDELFWAGLTRLAEMLPGPRWQHRGCRCGFPTGSSGGPPEAALGLRQLQLRVCQRGRVPAGQRAGGTTIGRRRRSGSGAGRRSERKKRASSGTTPCWRTTDFITDDSETVGNC